MLLSDIVCKAISLCVNRSVPFVAFAMPYVDDIRFFSEAHPSCEPQSDLKFIVNSWCAGSCEEYAIHDCADAQTTISLLTEKTELIGISVPVWSHATTRANYDDMLDLAIEHLQNYGGKIVLSRTITGDATNVDWLSVAEKYFSLHHEAFRYIYYTPKHGCWLGASPELLLNVESGRFSTMALAGTRDISSSKEPWSGKNIAEQAIVRDYIVDKIYDIGLNPVCEPTETVTTGNIQHLRTVISGDMSSIQPVDLLRSLNPTPALAGYPLHSALERIAALEHHPRRCYGAYIAVSATDSFSAYVNLRCVNFDTKHWCMYVGGGIMPDSDIQDEWDETEAKSMILRNLIEDSLNAK